MKSSKKYLFWFANNHAEFRFPEIESIVALLKTTIKYSEEPSENPFWIVELPSDNIAREIASRSVTLKHVTELWASSTTISELHDQLKQYSDNVLSQQTSLHTASFKFNVDVYCNTQNYSEKVAKIDSFKYLPFKGRVDLTNPDITLQYIEFFGNNPNDVPKEPRLVFFGKLINQSCRKNVKDLSLKTRTFIGNTSMDPELSLIMANQAKVTEGDLVYDPFVGSGSLLVAAAYFGGHVFGVDIDHLMVHGKTKQTRKQRRHLPRHNENVLANLKQYGLESRYLDVLVGDSSLPLWRSDMTLDAIITDPPYGVREATEKIGSYGSRICDSHDGNNKTTFPTKVVYSLDQILVDLLTFSAVHLKLNGRLVTWIPIFREDYSENVYIPEHSCFKLISNCEQVLSKVFSRRLLTFEKIKHPAENELQHYQVLDSNFRERFFSYKYGKEFNEMKKDAVT